MEIATTLGRIQLRGSLAVTIVATVAGVGWILYVDRHLSFFGDDWTLVAAARNAWPGMLFSAYNGHWILVHGLLYEALFVTVGLHSYLPYLLLMLTAHATSVVVLFVLIRRRAGAVLALMAVAILLLYGAAGEDLAWAFEIEFIAPVAFGLVALLLLDSPNAGMRRGAMAAALLTLGMASSGMGIVMFIAVAVELALDPDRRRLLPVLLPPAVIYGLWYVLVGHRTSIGPSLTLATITSLPEFVRHGLAPATAAVFGLSPRLSTVVMLATALFVAWAWWRRRRVGSRAVGPLVALISEFVLIGLTRSQLGISEGASSRYLYTAAVLILLVVADALSEFPARRLVLAPLLCVVAVSVWLNANQLVVFASGRSDFATRQTDELRTFEAYRGDPGITSDQLLDHVYTPITPRQYFDATFAWGSPVRPVATQDLSRLDPISVDRALVILFANALIAGPPPTTLGSCTPATQLTVPSGSTVYAIPDAGAIAVVHVAVLGPDSAAPSTRLNSVGTLTFGGDRLPGQWRISIAGGGLCQAG